MRSSRLIQGLCVLLLTIMVSLNLRILMVTHEGQNFFEDISNCEVVVRTSADIRRINISSKWYDWLSLNPNHSRVVGHHRPVQGYLTIGIPSIQRENGMIYVLKTLTSLVKHSTPEEQEQMVVVVFLADFDRNYNRHVIANLSRQFQGYIHMGFIQIVEASREFYPPLQGLKANFQDGPARVRWRAKQVSDYSFLFLYSKHLSTYYIQLEDDVRAAPGYFAAIKDFISFQRGHWALLEFSELGFIGKLFHSNDLQKLSQYMMTFYDEQPVDWLLRYFRLSMAQTKQVMRKPTLFQHEGLTSSFDTSHKNHLRDRYFDTGEKPWRGQDPPAAIFTTLVAHESYTADLAYGSGSGYFWAQSPKQGDTFTIVFDQSVRLKRVAMVTGHEVHPRDILKYGILEASPKLLRSTDTTAVCADWRRVGELDAGFLDALNLDQLLGGRLTKCLKVTVTQNQAEWMVIHQIAVFLDGKS